MRWLIFLYPWFELWSLIWLGTETTPLLALAWVFGALVTGGAMMRWAGRISLQRLAQARAGGILAQELAVADVALIFAGLLLAVPGLVSDVLALLVLIRPLRVRILGRWEQSPPGWRARSTPSEGVIEGEFSVKDVGLDTHKTADTTPLEPPK